MVLEYIDRENRDLQNILSKRILRDKWLTSFKKEKCPGTVKSYLASLNHFYIFAKCEKLEGVAATEEQLSLLSVQVKLWNKSIQRLVKGRFWEKRMDDLSSSRKPEQIKAFDLSKVARDAVKVLGKFQDKSSVDVPSNAEYTLVRDYVLTLQWQSCWSVVKYDTFQIQHSKAGGQFFCCSGEKAQNIHRTWSSKRCHDPICLSMDANIYLQIQKFCGKCF